MKEVVWPLEECFWKAAEQWGWKEAVTADMVRGANPGEEKLGYRGEKEEDILGCPGV